MVCYSLTDKKTFTNLLGRISDHCKSRSHEECEESHCICHCHNLFCVKCGRRMIYCNNVIECVKCGFIILSEF